MSSFRRSRENKAVFGIFSGLEKFLKERGHSADRSVLRLIYILLMIFTPNVISWGLFFGYFVVSLILPYEGED